MSVVHPGFLPINTSNRLHGRTPLQSPDVVQIKWITGHSVDMKAFNRTPRCQVVEIAPVPGKKIAGILFAVIFPGRPPIPIISGELTDQTIRIRLRGPGPVAGCAPGYRRRLRCSRPSPGHDLCDKDSRWSSIFRGSASAGVGWHRCLAAPKRFGRDGRSRWQYSCRSLFLRGLPAAWLEDS